jgi:uncharacterized protein
MERSFVWDPNKASSNAAKHGVSFEEAQTVFDDPLAVIFDDEAHSQQELREILIGHSTQNRLLIISFAEQANTIRIISARRATRNEQRDYEEGTGYVS